MREAGREQIVRGPNRGPGEPRPSSPRRAFGHGTPRRGDQPRLKSPVKPSWARLDHGEGVLRDRAAAWAPTRLWPRGRRLGQQLPLREDGTRGLGSAEVVLLTLHKRVQTRTCVQVGASDGLGCKDDDWVPPTCRNSCVLLEPTFSPALSFVLCPLHFHHGLRARAQREACGATTTCLRRAQAAHTATTGSKAPLSAAAQHHLQWCLQKWSWMPLRSCRPRVYPAPSDAPAQGYARRAPLHAQALRR